MNEKNFKEEVVLGISLLCGVLSFIKFATMGNPNALGENLFWLIGCIVFLLGLSFSAVIAYSILTIWEKKSPKSFSKMKATCINKLNSSLDAFIKNAEEEED